MEHIIRIERMGYGPEAVGHLKDGKAVFIDRAAPGDVVAVELTEEKPSFARGRIVRVEEFSPNRVAPFCEMGEACG